MRTAKTLFKLGGCPGWSESSLGAHSLCWFCHVVAHLWLLQLSQEFVQFTHNQKIGLVAKGSRLFADQKHLTHYPSEVLIQIISGRVFNSIQQYFRTMGGWLWQLTEPSHEIMVLFVLRKLILQTCMCSHPVGLDVWFLVELCIYFNTLSEPSLVAYVISTIISWAGSIKVWEESHFQPNSNLWSRYLRA